MSKKKKSLYEVLGISEDATEEEIKKAYKKQAMEAHPDREGGSEAVFYQITVAHKILSNSKSRKTYDETGEEDEPKDLKSEANQLVTAMFLNVLDTEDIDHTDIVAVMVMQITNRQREFSMLITKTENDIKKLEKAMKKIIRKKGENNLSAAIVAVIKGKKLQIVQCNTDIEMGREMLIILEDYTYVIDVVQPSFMTQNNWGSGAGGNSFFAP